MMIFGKRGRYPLAIHEASHACIAWAYGLDISHALLKSNSAEGYVELKNVSLSSLPRLVQVDLFLAGPAGERQHLSHLPHSLHDFLTDSETDDTALQQIDAKAWEIRNSYNRIKPLLDDYWPKIEALARELDRRGRLSGAEIETIWNG